jgi:hypothetical protein
VKYQSKKNVDLIIEYKETACVIDRCYIYFDFNVISLIHMKKFEKLI